MRKLSRPKRGPLQMVWSPADYDALKARLDRDWENHVATAMEQSTEDRIAAAERIAAAIQAVERGEQLNPVPCPVIDLFTRERVR